MIRKCLLVTESHVRHRVWSKILLRFGFTVTGEITTTAAAKACGVSMPEVIFVDAHFFHSQFAGLLLVREVRSMPGGDAPKIIVCFDLSMDEAEQEEATVAGANATLTLQVSTAALVADIGNALIAAGIQLA